MKKYLKLIAVFVISCMLVISSSVMLPASAASLSEVLETTYQLDQLLFGEDEMNGFTFVYYDKADSTIKQMVYVGIGESPWNPGLDMYTGPTEGEESEGYEYIILNYSFGVPTIHPSMMGNTGCAFTCPYTGTIKIMTYFRVGSVLPDSSKLSIYKNEVGEGTLIREIIGTEDGSTSEYVDEVEVSAGDIIYWFDDCMDSTANDSADFNPRIQYTAVNDENVSEDPVTEPQTTEQGDDTTEAPSTDETDEITTSGNVTTAAAETTGTGSGAEDNNNTVLYIIIAVAAVVIIAVAVVIIVKKKRK